VADQDHIIEAKMISNSSNISPQRSHRPFRSVPPRLPTPRKINRNNTMCPPKERNLRLEVRTVTNQPMDKDQSRITTTLLSISNHNTI